MASRARFTAAALLAAGTLSGLTGGTAGADPQPGTDRATGSDTADTVSERRSAARAEKPTGDQPRRPRCKRRDPECGGLGTPPAPEAPPSSDSNDGGGLPGVLPGRPAPLPEMPRIPPPLGEPQVPDLIDTVPGVGLPLNSPVGAPISVPVLPVPALAAPRPAAPAGPGPRPQAPPPRQS
ncbi:hypothetical protein H7K09_20290, partial [Mycolicibacterium duvalii]|nr:hypothetical protein [Mycolicibacterium duvalii]